MPESALEAGAVAGRQVAHEARARFVDEVGVGDVHAFGEIALGGQLQALGGEGRIARPEGEEPAVGLDERRGHFHLAALAQLLHARPDCKVVSFRGNVATRLAKLAAGEADATLLAAAGLNRLGESGVGHPLAADDWLPAPGQGAIAVECRANDADISALLAAIDHLPSRAEVTAGGVALGEVDSRTMRSKRAPGLFLAGEVLDLDGPIGGYNFQAAWSTGWLAGTVAGQEQP